MSLSRGPEWRKELGREGTIAPFFAGGAKGECSRNPEGPHGPFGCGQRLLSSGSPPGPCARFPFFAGRTSIPSAPGAGGRSGVWRRGPFAPERGEGSAAARSPVAAGKGALLPGRGRRPSLSRGPEERGRVSVSFCGRREGESMPKGRRVPPAPSVVGISPSCHLTAHPTSAPVVPLPPGRGSTLRPCGRDASAPWWGQGEMGLPPDALPKPRRGLLHAPRRFGLPLKTRLLWHSFAAISAK